MGFAFIVFLIVAIVFSLKEQAEKKANTAFWRNDEWERNERYYGKGVNNIKEFKYWVETVHSLLERVLSDIYNGYGDVPELPEINPKLFESAPYKDPDAWTEKDFEFELLKDKNKNKTRDTKYNRCIIPPSCGNKLENQIIDSDPIAQSDVDNQVAENLMSWYESHKELIQEKYCEGKDPLIWVMEQASLKMKDEGYCKGWRIRHGWYCYPEPMHLDEDWYEVWPSCCANQYSDIVHYSSSSNVGISCSILTLEDYLNPQIIIYSLKRFNEDYNDVHNYLRLHPELRDYYNYGCLMKIYWAKAESFRRMRGF